MTSLDSTISDPRLIELVLVTDTDDASYQRFQKVRFNVKRLEAPPRQTMGRLNTVGYEASSGKWIFLLNDDVTVETRGWDKHLAGLVNLFSDEICLVHVNDGIFRDNLCTFPLVSRTFCELMGGICNEDYNRYRIDDHIYHVFRLLSYLGHNRIVYVDELLFDHKNRKAGRQGIEAYRLNPIIHALDTEIYDSLLETRKEQAIRLCRHIDEWRLKQKSTIRANRLSGIRDSDQLRGPEFHTTLSLASLLPSPSPRVTVGIVSANINSEFARRCLDSVKQFTTNYDLTVLDNNHGPQFNHPREMNRILSVCRTDFLVLMDDDVIVEAGWLEGMLRSLGPDVGVVTPLHKNSAGRLSYAGVVLKPDDTGHHSHNFGVPQETSSIQTLCSAIMLIDVRKCGHIQVDESYSKYFLDIDYGLRIWEAGYRVVQSPYTCVTHIGGATLPQGSSLSNELFETQRSRFVEQWMHTGRYLRLTQSKKWRDEPQLQALERFRLRFIELMSGSVRETGRDAVEDIVRDLARTAAQRPALLTWAAETLRRDTSYEKTIPPNSDIALSLLWGYFAHPVLVEAGYQGLNIVVSEGVYYAIPQTEGAFEVQKVLRREYSRAYRASGLPELRRAIAENLQVSLETGPAADFPGPQRYTLRLIEEGYRGFNIVEYDRYYGLRVSDGVYDDIRLLAEAKAKDSRLVAGDSPEQVKAAIDQLRPAPAPSGIHKKIARFVKERFSGIRRTRAQESNTAREGRAESDEKAWLAKSPARLIETHRSFDIYEFEYKFFCVPQGLGEFNYSEFVGDQRLARCLVGQSRDEARTLIDLAVDEARERKVVTLSDLDLGDDGATEYKELLRLVPRGATPSKFSKLLGVDHEDAIGDHLLAPEQTQLMRDLESRKFTEAVISWRSRGVWRNNSLEMAAARLAPVVTVLLPNKARHSFLGEGRHRLIYNKAYLSSLFSRLPLPVGKSVLEVGCSDGMVCYLMAALGATYVSGVDIMQTAGCVFPHERVRYSQSDAHSLPFEDATFDLVISIATFEHLRDPKRAFSEIIRVLRPGGHAYVQAGPLFCSPFGHHMFGYFDEYPWIHLRLPIPEIAAYAAKTGVAARIAHDHGRSAEDYVRGMLSPDHVNRLKLADYGLEKLARRNDVVVLFKNISREGENLLTDHVLKELSQYDRPTLIEHGFELIVRKSG